MRNLEIITNAAMTIRRQQNNNRTMKTKRISSLSALLIAAGSVLIATGARAAVVDLGTNGSGEVDGALFSVVSPQPTGTGVFDPFLTVQDTPWEQGYNSNTGDFNTKRDPQWNHEIQFKDLQVTTVNGIAYFGFLVDVNEPNGSKDGISLNGLRIYTSSTIQHSTSTDANGFFNGSLGTLRYDLGANQVLYKDTQHGSGSGDITMLIPVSNFAGAQPNDYVYMYQRWGNTDFSEGGFEETAILQGVTPVPEARTIFPIVGLLAAVFSTQFVRRRQLQQVSK